MKVEELELNDNALFQPSSNSSNSKNKQKMSDKKHELSD